MRGKSGTGMKTMMHTRIDQELLTSFQETCASLSTNPSELIRQWVALFVKNHKTLIDKSVPGELPASYSLPKQMARM